MIRTISFESKSDFLPSFHLDLWISNLDLDMTEKLRQFVLEEEPKIIDKFGYMNPSSNGGPNFLTQRLYLYNIFHYQNECIDDLYHSLKKEFIKFLEHMNKPLRKTYIHGWGNVIRKGYNISKHAHTDANIENMPMEYAYLSGSMCLYAENTKTSYKNPYIFEDFFPIDNVIGQNILFPSYIMHMTDFNNSDIPRVSLAYDIITQEQYDLIPDKARLNKKFWIPFTNEI